MENNDAYFQSIGDSEGTTLVNVVDALSANFGTNISTLLKCAVDRHKVCRLRVPGK